MASLPHQTTFLTWIWAQRQAKHWLNTQTQYLATHIYQGYTKTLIDAYGTASTKNCMY